VARTVAIPSDVFMGVPEGSDQIFVATEAGNVVEARSFRRLPPDARADGEGFLRISGVPWQQALERDAATGLPVAQPAILMNAAPVPGPLPVAPAREDPAPRQLYVRRRDIDRYGVTVGCPGCQSISTGGVQQPHSAVCRERVRAELLRSGDDGAIDRIRRTEEAIDQHLADRVQQNVADGFQQNVAERVAENQAEIPAAAAPATLPSADVPMILSEQGAEGELLEDAARRASSPRRPGDSVIPRPPGQRRASAGPTPPTARVRNLFPDDGRSSARSQLSAGPGSRATQASDGGTILFEWQRGTACRQLDSVLGGVDDAVARS